MNYSDGHAALYDAFKTKKQYETDVNELLPFLDEHGVSRIVDVGCGTGKHAAILSDHGFNLLGIDNSPAMLNVARTKHPDIPFKQQSAEKPLPKSDAITLFDSVLTYLKRPNRNRALREYADALTLNGLLYLNIAFTSKTTPESFNESNNKQATCRGTTYKKQAHPTRDENQVKSHIKIENLDDGTIVDETNHTHHIVDPETLRDQLRTNDFEIINEYGHQQSPWQNWEVICARR